MKLPTPCTFNYCRRWPLSELEKAEAEARGAPPPEPRNPADERYLSDKQVAQRYGVSRTTVWRWSEKAAEA